MDVRDTIERAADFAPLFEVLNSVKDKNGNPGVITPFMNLANPNYEKIEADGFKTYHSEPLYETHARYGEAREVKEMFRQGIEAGVFLPQFHGREHLSVPLWMRALKEGEPTTVKGFKRQYYSVLPDPSFNNVAKGFRSAFYFESTDDLPYMEHSIKDGVAIFKEYFGRKPTVFDPPNGVFTPALEHVIAQEGMMSIGTQYNRNEPDGQGGYAIGKYTFGQRNAHGQIYYIRNCQFEPWSPSNAEYCMSMIAAAFQWGRPAIISNHRATFAGGIMPENRTSGLAELKKLLTSVKKRWPDVEFMSSGDLAVLMHQQSKF